MLVVERKEGERVRIVCPDGTELWVMFVRFAGPSKIRLGIDAPKNYGIAREELIGKPQEDKR